MDRIQPPHSIAEFEMDVHHQFPTRRFLFHFLTKLNLTSYLDKVSNPVAQMPTSKSRSHFYFVNHNLRANHSLLECNLDEGDLFADRCHLLTLLSCNRKGARFPPDWKIEMPVSYLMAETSLVVVQLGLVSLPKLYIPMLPPILWPK